jgi:hypothetical protein
LVLEQKIVLPGYRYIWPLTYISKSNQGINAYFCLKKICILVYVVIIKHIFCMNDRLNICYKIYDWDLTLTFISRSYLGQKHVKTANSLKIFSRNINARGEQKAVSQSLWGPFSNLFDGNFLWPIFFQLCFQECKVNGKSKFQCYLLYYWF